MRLSKKLQAVAEWLKSEHNDLIVSAEDDDRCLVIVAEALVRAAEEFDTASDNIKAIEPEIMTLEKLDELAAVAEAFDASGDELLEKQASVIDDLLIMLGTTGGVVKSAKEAEDAKIDQIKKKYQEPKKQIDEGNHIAEATKAIEKSQAYKTYRPLEQPLSTRVCVEHQCQMARVGENRYQCALDKKIFDYNEGYTTIKGNKVPPTSVSGQTQHLNDFGDLIFETRADKTGMGKE